MPINCYEVDGVRRCFDSETGESVADNATPSGSVVTVPSFAEQAAAAGLGSGGLTAAPKPSPTTPAGPAGTTGPVFGQKIPGTNVVYLGVDLNGRAVTVQAGRSTSVVNGKLIDSETGEVIADYGSGSGGASSGVSRQNTIDTLAQQKQIEASKLAEDQRQYNETLGMTKSKFDQEMAQKKAELGMRPETLARYLYALRGQQTPQQLLGAAGAPAIGGAQAMGGVAPILEGGGAQAGATLAAPALAPTLLDRQNIAPANNYPGVTNVNALIPSLQNPANVAAGGDATLQNPREVALLAELRRAGASQDTLMQNARLTGGGGGGGGGFMTDGGWERRFDPADRQYAKGGVIPEPVVGRGLVSGQTYTFGEEGPEKVEPAEEPYSDGAGPSAEHYGREMPSGTMGGPRGAQHQDIFEVLLNSAEEAEYSETDKMGKKRTAKVKRGGKVNSYADGGTIGYSKDYDPKVFNPPNLGEVVSRGYNTPGVPLLPQVGLMTGGGQSLIPSAQTFFQALPSERAAYSGFLEDEAGVVPEDVTALMQKLAPQVGNLRTPRFSA